MTGSDSKNSGNDRAEADAAWEERWSTGRTGWDQSRSHQSLVTFLASPEASNVKIDKCKTAFVPGCGSGYDVHLLASVGIDTIGLDVAPTAIEKAKQWIAAQPSTTGKAEVVSGDYFTYETEHPFDLVYDYTFLCALPPHLRPQWASTILRLTHPSSLLITLMFPLPPSAKSGGPPFALSEEIYEDLLGDHWESVWRDDVPEAYRRKGGGPGEEKFVIWRRR